MAPPGNLSAYDKLRDKLDARDLIHRLGLDVVSELGAEIQLRPLCHESQSGASLHVNAHTGRWMCRACHTSGVYGDLIQLVEYARTGGQPPTHGAAQRNSSDHIDGLRWLCGEYGIPFGKDGQGAFVDPALDVLHMFAMEAHRYLLDRKDVLEWIERQWGFDRSIVEGYGLGFMPAPLLPSIVNESKRRENRAAFDGSGLGWYGPGGEFCTRFEGRVLFPYLEHGRAVYLIGRSTPWTPTRPGEDFVPKYYKLRVHSKERSHISPSITNTHLYNETVMSGSDSIVVAEGIADAVALSAMGVPVVSPVTISFNRTDKSRFLAAAKRNKTQRVEIVFDNEASGNGPHNAMKTARSLIEGGLRATVLTLPLGPEQQAAEAELRKSMGEELFARFERSDPNERKQIVTEAFPDDAMRKWVQHQINSTKLDVAEWAAAEGVGSSARFERIRKKGRDLVEFMIEDDATNVEPDDSPPDRLAAFSESMKLAAHVDDRLTRQSYAGMISALAGKGVDKATVAQRIAQIRRDTVTPARKEQEEVEQAENRVEIDLRVMPPDPTHSGTAPPPPPPPPAPGVKAPPVPTPIETEHDRYEKARNMVANCVENKWPKEELGKYISETILVAMGFTPFQCPDDIYLVRGNERVPVGTLGPSPRFDRLLYMASGLTRKEGAHRGYIAATEYFLALDAPRADVVSWSHIEPENAAAWFPTGDKAGRMLRISRGAVEQTRMAKARVPAVAGGSFLPFRYIEGDGDADCNGIDAAMRVFRWTSLSEGDRMLLLYWLVCLPIVRLVGQIPIVRIEGGSSSGKTRTVDAVSYLVNGQKRGSVPTAAALSSLLSTEMLVIDDNREANDVSARMRGILLQATTLGASEKRKSGTDSGTVVERVCGGLLMNGVEPIHDGRGELASRFLTLQCSSKNRAADSPAGLETLLSAVLAVRDRFWSEASRRCAWALEQDVQHGEELGEQIEGVFAASRIGRLGQFLRMMYLAWVGGLPESSRPAALQELAPQWVEAFGSISRETISSLVGEELAVTAVRYVFSYGRSLAKQDGLTGASALDGAYTYNTTTYEERLGPMRASRLARLAREAGKHLNAPRAVAQDLKTGQLEARILDGKDYFAAVGIHVDTERTGAGRLRLTLRRVTDGDPIALTEGGEGSVEGAPASEESLTDF